MIKELHCTSSDVLSKDNFGREKKTRGKRKEVWNDKSRRGRKTGRKETSGEVERGEIEWGKKVNGSDVWYLPYHMPL